jgi:tripartite-type tricarboxylate transporter receptor subunit TctC
MRKTNAEWHLAFLVAILAVRVQFAPRRRAEEEGVRARGTTVRRLCGTLAAALLLCSRANADDYPSKPIRLVVATAAGGASDIVARTVGQKLGESLKQPVVVDPRPGANGNLAAELVAAAPADGYTLMMGTIGVLAINPFVYENVGYQPQRDFAPVARLVSFANLLVVHPKVPATTVRELIEHARKNPGALHYGSPGAGGSPHMAMVMFERMAGVEMVHVPYKGAAPALNDLLGGHIELAFSDAVATLPHVAAGRLRALAASGSDRLAAAPDIPTVAEAGLPGYDVSGWLGIVAPAATLRGPIALLNAELNRIVRLPEIAEKLTGQGAQIKTGTPEEFGAFIRQEGERWSKIVAEAGIRAQ